MPLPALVRWILFDAVGTLIYPARPVAETYQSVARRLDVNLDSAEIGQRFAAAFAREFGSDSGLSRPPTSEAHEHARWQRIVAAVLPELPAAAGEPFGQLWHHFAQPSSWRVFDDAVPTLDELSRRGYRLGIASNFDSRLLSIVRALSPLAVIDRVFVSSEIGFSKPDERYFRAVQTRLSISASEILLVGDDLENDCLGAQAAGWQTVLLARELNASFRPHVASLTELLS